MTHDLTIVGGIYVERCIQPLWDAVYGSAGRAAHAVRNLIPGRIILHSYVAPEMKAQAEHVASDCDATLMPTSAKHNLSFSYLHPMSVPAIFPTPRHIEAHVPISVKGDVVLRFGMLEGDAIVEANVAVYDPQSAFDVALFQANGSRARRLAVVMNRHETEQMTRSEEHTSELQSPDHLVCRLLLEKKNMSTPVTSFTAKETCPDYKSEAYSIFTQRCHLYPDIPDAFALLDTWQLLLFFFNDTATTEISTLSLHDALPI